MERLRAEVGAMEGVGECVAAGETLTVRYDPSATSTRKVVRQIATLGHGATPVTRFNKGGDKDASVRMWRRRFVASLLMTLPLTVISMVLMNIPSVAAALKRRVLNVPLAALIQGLIATPVQFVLAAPLYSAAFKGTPPPPLPFTPAAPWPSDLREPSHLTPPPQGCCTAR
jgi:cation transport ATPase